MLLLCFEFLYIYLNFFKNMLRDSKVETLISLKSEINA